LADVIQQSDPTPQVEATLEGFNARERSRLRRIEISVLAVTAVCIASIAAVSMYTNDPWTARLLIAGELFLVLPAVLLVRDHLRAAAFFTALVPLVIITINCAVVGGFKDGSALAFPVVIIYAGMTLGRRGFIGFLALVGASMYAVEYNQMHQVVPLVASTQYAWGELVSSAIIMAVTAFAVWLLAEGARNGLGMAHREIELRGEAEARLAALSNRDVLTGVYSRRYFEEELGRLAHSRRYPVSVIVADVDGLKALNDTLGHAAGDELLTRAAEIICSVIRPDDVLARTGGDEFAILLPGTDTLAADGVVQRIETRLADYAASGANPHVAISFGTATALEGGLTDALRTADALMYERKAARKASFMAPAAKSASGAVVEPAPAPVGSLRL
jgi:diguanylate cyclase (GGDEF)-like protein